jgi:hypothetical protein
MMLLTKIFRMRNHTAISAVIAVIVISFMILTYPRANIVSHYIVLPLQKKSISLPAQDPQTVGLYRYLSSGATSIARINIERHADNQNQNIEDNMLKLARNLAAKMGANGLVLRLGGYSDPGGVESGLSGYVMQFIAVKTGPNDVPIYSEIEEPSIATVQ